MRFSLRLIVLTLLVAALVAPAAQAEVSIIFNFSDMTTTTPSKAGQADEDPTKWTVAINASSTVSSVNVFGVRPRLQKGDVKVGSYTLCTKKTTYTENYYKGKVDAGAYVYINGKKDTSSTYGGPLNVYGTFYP